MGIVLENAILCDLDPVRVEAGALRLDGGVIVARGESVDRQAGDETVDCGGCVVMPGFVNGHTHLYSALATGMPSPRETPCNFHEILKFIWWRLDRALDDEGVEQSALIGALDAIRCGTTTLIDHHASPNAIEGSLDRVAAGVGRAGIRGVLCYEVTDRNGMAGRDAGVEENRRWLAACNAARNGRFAGLVGAHASFTCSDDTMAALRDLMDESGAGIHIHVAEDPVDEELCRQDHRTGLIERLANFGMMTADSIFGHCTHLTPSAFDLLKKSGTAVAHNTRSNMNNAVGYTPVGEVGGPLLLGTDGIGANMWSEAQTAWFKSRDGGAGISPARVVEMLAENARRASRALGVTLGRLDAGAAADVVLTTYRPATPLSADNLPGHLIFSMGSQHVAGVIGDGHWLLRNEAIQTLDEAEARARSQVAARKLWDGMAELD